MRAPASTREAARRELARDWSKRTKTLERLAHKRPADLSDEEIHQLRVTTRRLRASLWVLRHCTESKPADRAQHNLRALGAALGKRRMLDVALRDANAYGGRTGGIEKRRRRAQAEMTRALRGGNVRALVKDLKALERVIPGARLERLTPWLQGYEWELAYRLEQQPKLPEARHDLRIRGKKVRYVLECLGRHSRSLERMQEHLGREHDLAVVRDFVGSRPGIARDERAARVQANRIMATALRSAMKELHVLQKEIKG